MQLTNSDLSKIKLIIWDLDETFWKGTLSDYKNNVEPISDNIDLVKKLTSRGIVNSICSKNDEKEAKAKLEEIGILECFVFNSIDWTPKGNRIKDIIHSMALRDANVLFIDDNISNLKEVQFICPNIMISLPNIIPMLIEHVDQLGKDDSKWSRLKQYKVLEKKVSIAKSYSSNEDFLKDSEIKICIQEDCYPQINRIHELLMRSNQLNFTKQRIGIEQLKELIEDPSVRTGYVMVSDKYGVYGLVGFFAMKEANLLHYFFSCRTMGMGIEQFVYAYLGFPELQIVEPVSGSISPNAGKPSYISVVDSIEEIAIPDENNQNHFHILFKGPCDLQVMASYIETSTSNIDKEFNFIDVKGNQADFYNHSINILNSYYLSKEQKNVLCQKIPFISRESLETQLFSGKYDFVCLSPLMDATLSVYRDKETQNLFSFGLYNKPLTDPNYWNDYLSGSVMTAARCHYTPEMIQSFAQQFDTISFSPQEIANNFYQIYQLILKANPKTKLVILLLSELPFKPLNQAMDFMPDKEIIHKEINHELIQVFKDTDVFFIDVNKYINGQSDYFDNINHYSKSVYYHLSKEFLQYVSSVSEITISSSSVLKVFIENLKRRIYKEFILRFQK